MRKETDKCSDSGPLYPTDHTQPDAKAAIDAANSMLNDIKKANPDYIGSARGSDCEVEIVVNVPEAMMGNAARHYDPKHDRMVFMKDEINRQSTTFHKNMAFKIVLGTDLEQLNSGNVYAARQFRKSSMS